MILTLINNLYQGLFLALNVTCTLENLASYAINVFDAGTVTAGIKFAQEKKY